MAKITTGQSFNAGDQLTSTKLNNIIGTAFLDSDSVTGTTLNLTSGQLKVATNGITDNEIINGAVTTAKLDSSILDSLMPTATVLPYAGLTAPTGYLLCDGAAISRTTYSDLFGIIGLTYGIGDGSTTFNIPDLRGRVIAGQDDMGGTSADRLTNQSGGLNGDNLGATGGSETHALTEAQMPKHYHQMRGPNSITAPQDDGGTTGHGLYGGGTPDDAAQEYGTYSTGGSASSGSQSTGTSNGNNHNNVQPTIILNYIIKT
jgi:microcystin-dependent protein